LSAGDAFLAGVVAPERHRYATGRFVTLRVSSERRVPAFNLRRPVRRAFDRLGGL